jgi:hypothetical protein
MVGRSFYVACVALLVACSSGGGSSVLDAGAANATVPANAHWCAANPPSGCGAAAVCGACVEKPTTALVRTTDTKEYKGTGAPDVTCFDVTKPPTPVGTSKKVKMKGWVKIFANGPDSKGVKVEVFQEQVDAGGQPTGALGALVGTGTSDDKAAACGSPAVFPCALEEKRVKNGTESTRILYPFEIDGIPTEVPLIVKTSEAIADAGWFPLYDYNVAARNDQLSATGEFEFNVRALGNDDYSSILRSAYSQPPTGGESAVAGEVHDCGDVRLSNATVGIFPKPRYSLFYMSEVEDGPLPDSNRKATGKLGLYAVGGAKPGTFTVSAAGLNGSELVALGSYKVQTFADSVSVYTFRGIRPWQIPKK